MTDDCPSPATCTVPCCVRERRRRHARNFLCSLLCCVGLLLLLAGCATCRGGERRGCPPVPFVYLPG